MNQTVTVIARAKAKKGKEAELREALVGLLAPTRSEEGCINYDMHVSTEDPGLFFFHENWKSRESIGRHMEAPHVKAILARAPALLAESLQIHFLSRVEANAPQHRC